MQGGGVFGACGGGDPGGGAEMNGASRDGSVWYCFFIGLFEI